MSTIVITKDQVRHLIVNAPIGRTMIIGFTKRNGETRYITTIKGIDFGVQGFGAPYDAREKGIFFAYDVNLAKEEDPENCWRAVRLDSVFSVETEGELYLLQNENKD